MDAPDAPAPLAQQALDNLVTQFSSALDCLRELVQNSMDAGSPQIDVWFELHGAAEGAEGTIAIHVDDYGVGMDEAVIDGELTQLFASSKEDDLTKIGKFGIGFVSIFALAPHAVLLHTGRGGEFWEILFHDDRSFTKTRVEAPVEGTQITLYLVGDEQRYGELVSGARDTLKRWCCHSEVEITLEDRSGLTSMACAEGPERINEDFSLEGPVSVYVEEEGTQMALSYDLSPTFSFYNKGLTLAVLRDPDEVPSRFRNISFKIKSRYLEHTLSRETVLRDENHHKAMQLLLAAADGALHSRLIEAIEAVVAAPQFGVAQEQRYHELMSFVLREPGEAVRALDKRPLLRTVHGTAVDLATVADAARQDGRIFISAVPSALTEALAAQGIPVLWGQRRGDVPSEEEAAKDGAAYRAALFTTLDPAIRLVVSFVAYRLRAKLMHRFLALLTQANYGDSAVTMVKRPEEVFLGVLVDTECPPGAAQLIGRAGELLERVGGRYRRLTGCVLSAPAEPVPLFLVARTLGPLMAIPPDVIDEKKRPRRPEAAVNRDHPQFQALLRLHERAPGLAAYCLAKDLLLREDRLIERDLDLMAAALPEARLWPKRAQGAQEAP